MADPTVIHAYRHLYRGLLQAVQYSKPARYTARDQLRRAFREKGAEYDYRSIARTIRFLTAATKQRGLEHRVLKNLIIIAWYRYDNAPSWRSIRLDQIAQEKKRALEKHVEATVYDHYDMTIAMLNKSMGLCLR
ncbi:hypothetical protein ANO14919_025810 [Xylariales sp. No.14919]|nr:DUF1763-domain-containing protein [Xylaria grammica]GAW13201.1 hypothetical protein ANO14919_025810 [Xylariales sp. No.14919]